MQKNIAILCGLIISMSLSASESQPRVKVGITEKFKSRLYNVTNNANGALFVAGAAKWAYSPLCTAAWSEMARLTTMVTPAMLQRYALSACKFASKLCTAIPVPALVTKAVGSIASYAPSVPVCMLGAATIIFAGKVVFKTNAQYKKVKQNNSSTLVYCHNLWIEARKSAEEMKKPALISAAVILGLGILGANKSLTIA